jgi:hypothetical protein
MTVSIASIRASTSALGEEAGVDLDGGRAGPGHVADREAAFTAAGEPIRPGEIAKTSGVAGQAVPAGGRRERRAALDDEGVQVGAARPGAAPVHDRAAAVVAGQAEAVLGAEVHAHQQRVVLQVAADAGQRPR